jgi:hypothetical protein
MSAPSNQAQTNLPTPEGSAIGDAQLVDALSGLNARADHAVVHRTRRAVMEAAHRMGAAEVRRRRQLGTVLLAVVALVVLLTPAIWSVADDLFSGEHFQDMPAMTMSLIVTLFSAIFAALIVNWRSRGTHDGEKF